MTCLYNITFICSHTDTPAAIDYIKNEIIPTLSTPETTGKPRLLRLRTTQAEATSLPLEFQFKTISQLKNWREKHLNPAMQTLALKWGEQLMHFDSILEQIN